MCRLWMIYFLNVAISVANCLIDPALQPNSRLQGSRLPGFQGAVPVLGVGKKNDASLPDPGIETQESCFSELPKGKPRFFSSLTAFSGIKRICRIV
jgi:hypothetical protein